MHYANFIKLNFISWIFLSYLHSMIIFFTQKQFCWKKQFSMQHFPLLLYLQTVSTSQIETEDRIGSLEVAEDEGAITLEDLLRALDDTRPSVSRMELEKFNKMWVFQSSKNTTKLELPNFFNQHFLQKFNTNNKIPDIKSPRWDENFWAT